MDSFVTVDLTTHLGSLSLPNPIMTASGTAGHGAEFQSFFDLADLGAHVVKSLGDAISQVTQANQNNMMIHSGGNSHLPLLTPSSSIEQQAAKIGEPLRQDDDPDQRHEKMK